MNWIYVEREVAEHPRVEVILKRFPRAQRIEIEHYGEIFNRKAQNFRLQKSQPALILAKKHQGFLHEVPQGYGVGHDHNYYFSHYLNCPYDCRYCFLQGLYNSAHQVCFVNFEDFHEAMQAQVGSLSAEESVCFFSGYDGDSLAMEGVTGFAQDSLSFFENHPQAFLELRTKSVQMRALLEREAMANVILALSLTPEEISSKHEHGVPSIDKRLQAAAKVAEAGWPIGLRLDPLIWSEDFDVKYEGLLEEVFGKIPAKAIHSVSFGAMRFPVGMHAKMAGLYPEEALLQEGLVKHEKRVSYGREKEEEMTSWMRSALVERVGEERVFHCPLD